MSWSGRAAGWGPVGAIFGDDSQDYGEALKQHYEQGAPVGWEENHVSAYATMHPWEDFAEIWAHYLHIVDTLETASAFGLRIHPYRTDHALLHADINFDPYKAKTITALIDAWLPLTFAMNALNHSMGHADMYPFVLSQPVIQKLDFIHDLWCMDGWRRQAPPGKPGLPGKPRRARATKPTSNVSADIK